MRLFRLFPSWEDNFIHIHRANFLSFFRDSSLECGDSFIHHNNRMLFQFLLILFHAEFKLYFSFLPHHCHLFSCSFTVVLFLNLISLEINWTCEKKEKKKIQEFHIFFYQIFVCVFSLIFKIPNLFCSEDWREGKMNDKIIL